MMVLIIFCTCRANSHQQKNGVASVVRREKAIYYRHWQLIETNFALLRLGAMPLCRGFVLGRVRVESNGLATLRLHDGRYN